MPTPTINPETGTKYSRAELKAAFELVENKTNWKMPIDKSVKLNKKEMAVIAEAVRFFAGCTPTFTLVNKRMSVYRVEAPGYYKAVGA